MIPIRYIAISLMLPVIVASSNYNSSHVYLSCSGPAHFHSKEDMDINFIRVDIQNKKFSFAGDDLVWASPLCNDGCEYGVDDNMISAQGSSSREQWLYWSYVISRLTGEATVYVKKGPSIIWSAKWYCKKLQGDPAANQKKVF